MLDVVVHAAKLRAGCRRRLGLVLASLLWSGCAEYLSARARLTANILWAPTTPARALALAATAGPWLALACAAVSRRGGRRRAAAGQGAR